jgi:hypothetical protein
VLAASYLLLLSLIALVIEVLMDKFRSSEKMREPKKSSRRNVAVQHDRIRLA